MPSHEAWGFSRRGPPKVTANLPWTPDEDKRLLELKGAGKATAVIAKELKRTEAAVIARTGVLNQK
jgi:hypothetical protein